MIGSLALYLWVLVPSSLFAVYAGYVVLVGRWTNGTDFHAPKDGSAPSREGRLANVMRTRRPPDVRRHPPLDAAVPDEMAPAGIGAVLETAPATPGPQRPRA